MMTLFGYNTNSIKRFIFHNKGYINRDGSKVWTKDAVVVRKNGNEKIGIVEYGAFYELSLVGNEVYLSKFPEAMIDFDVFFNTSLY